jgi:hypothetical protein
MLAYPIFGASVVMCYSDFADSFIGGRAACAISWSAKQGTGQPSYGSVIDSLSDLNRR